MVSADGQHFVFVSVLLFSFVSTIVRDSQINLAGRCIVLTGTAGVS